MNIAYLILAHGRPAQLARLVAALPRTAPIFIHFDLRAAPEVFADARQRVLNVAPSAVFVRRHRCRWGNPGIMYATLELIRQLTRAGVDFDYATLLSGVDYPIKSHAFIEESIVPGKEYLECFPLLAPNRWSGDGGNFNAAVRMHGRFVRFRSRIWRLGRRALPKGVVAFGGSQWWTLSKEALTHVTEVAENDRSFIRFLGGSFIPDEHFMQTILGNSLFIDRIVQDDLRFAIWDRPEPPYPATLGPDDLPALAASDKHHARKFDFDKHPRLPDRIDMELRG